MDCDGLSFQQFPFTVQAVYKVSWQFNTLITKANELTNLWKILQNEK